MLGIATLLFLGYMFSYDRKSIKWKTIIRLFSSLIITAFIIKKFSFGTLFIQKIADGFSFLYNSAERGTEFLFGSLANTSGPWGFIFLVKVFPVIIFFSALISLLHYLGFLQWLVGIIGKVVRPLLGTRGPETLCAIANSFLGQTEAPILIKSYLAGMNESEIFAVMVAGMGTVSAGIMAVYSSLGISMYHLLTTSLMSISSTLLMAKLWYPDKTLHKDSAKELVEVENVSKSHNAFDALAQGASDGAMLVINIGAMLIVTISLLGLFDDALCVFSRFIAPYVPFSTSCLSMRGIFGIFGVPAAWFLGIDNAYLLDVGHLIGVKVAVNEMVAFSKMAEYAFDSRTHTLLSYTLCGFSNFSSIGIQLGGIGILAPGSRSIIGKLGVRAVFAAACANILNAYVMGLFI